MPLLAKLIAAIATGAIAVFSRFMSFSLALKFASYTAWIAVLTAYLASVYVCITSLRTMVVSFLGSTGGINGGIGSAFAMGVGMLIPSNAAGVLSCVASVWIATQVYKIQKDGIHNYSK